MAIDKSDFQKSAPVVQVHMEIELELIEELEEDLDMDFGR
jgi:hypothetical protein